MTTLLLHQLCSGLGLPSLKVIAPGPHASVSVLRARGFRVVRLRRGRLLLYTPIRHWTHAL